MHVISEIQQCVSIDQTIVGSITEVACKQLHSLNQLLQRSSQLSLST